jgi:transcriptional regulator with PAS, ATPase and Fis domain
MQERCIQRLGAKKAHPVQVRIIAATNKPLEKDVKAGKFRSDLYYRLNEFTILIPPLRKRKDDLPYLAKKFIDEVGEELKKRSAGISREVLSVLVSYHWPGNVRELRNVIRQAVLLCEENIPIKTEHLMFSTDLVPAATEGHPSVYINEDEGGGLREKLRSTTAALEKKIIAEVLKETKGNKSKAARKLEIDYKTLLRKIKIHGI